MIRPRRAKTLPSKPIAARVRFDADNMWVDLVDGRQLAVPLAYFPRLLHATPAERGKYETSGGGTGLHWDHLDEDISVEGLLLGVGDRTVSKLKRRPSPSSHRPSASAKQKDEQFVDRLYKRRRRVFKKLAE